MDVLLDTHALLWWLSDDPALTKSARKAIADTRNAVYVSAASAWEIATKVRLGKLPTATELASDFAGFLDRERFQTIAISVEHAVRALASRYSQGPFRSPNPKRKTCRSSATRQLFDSYGNARDLVIAWRVGMPLVLVDFLKRFPETRT